MRASRLAVLVLLLATTTACAPTAFTGAAHFPGGPAACRATCARDGLEMSGFVYSGEFATSCICRPPGASADAAAAADVSGAVGVILATRRQREPRPVLTP